MVLFPPHDVPRRLCAVIDRLLDRAALSHGWATALLLVLTLVTTVPGFVTLFPMDRDEPRFAQASPADAGDRRLRRHPPAGRGAQQEAGRHLLATGGGRDARRSGGRARRTGAHLGLPDPVAARSHRRRPAHLLDGPAAAAPAGCGPRRCDDGGHAAGGGRGASRQDRCGAARDRDGRDGRAGPRMDRPRHADPRPGALRCLLDGAGDRHSGEGTDHADDPALRRDRTEPCASDRPAGCWRCVRCRVWRGACSSCCPGSC